MNTDGLPERPRWDEENGRIDLPLVDEIINDVLIQWGAEIQDYSDPEWHLQVADSVGPGEAVEYSEIYSLLRDLVQHTINTTKTGTTGEKEGSS